MQVQLRKTKIIYFGHFKAYVVIILLFSNVKAVCEMLSLTGNTQLHKGLKIISCHVCTFNHLKEKTDFNPTAHQPKKQLAKEQKGECMARNHVATQLLKWKILLLSAVKNLSSYIFSKKASQH